jgi:hypothetical protein
MGGEIVTSSCIIGAPEFSARPVCEKIIIHLLGLAPEVWLAASYSDLPLACLQERAGARHFSQLAFFARVGHSLSGNATPLQKMQFKAWTPSDCHASFAAAGSSQDIKNE